MPQLASEVPTDLEGFLAIFSSAASNAEMGALGSIGPAIADWGIRHDRRPRGTVRRPDAVALP